jgi:hypothetical protein
MNGLDLARAVRKKHPDLLVVLAPGYSDAAGQAAGIHGLARDAASRRCRRRNALN